MAAQVRDYFVAPAARLTGIGSHTATRTPAHAAATGRESNLPRSRRRAARTDPSPPVSIAENQDQLLDRLLANQETLQANQEAIVSLLEELTRDAATTRRLWLRLAQRYGWLDDEQNVAQPDTPS